MSMMESYTPGDPASILNAQLASALSTMGDAQYWEENISPTTIRQSLASSDPSNPNSTPALLKGMKWLLASISKGRDVSDFYPHVVKLVGSTSLEVRKMVYMFLVQYADHDDTTRELSLLSINSFQRGLADSEQLIRALALRVLTSIRIPDILQIQILGVQKCAKDNSPYVRKCAANALAKLSPRCHDPDQHEMLLDIMKQLLEEDSSTMVLTSTIVAFTELCPQRLECLHTCFRKLCHLLTDMDEWGQVVVVDCLSRYCRQFFKEPRAWKQGTAEKIDRERRVRRTLSGIAIETNGMVDMDALAKANEKAKQKHKEEKKDPHAPKRVKRRVIKKGFYSDEEDESTEEEVYEQGHHLAGAMRQRTVMGFSDHVDNNNNTSAVPAAAINEEADEDEDLNEDHRLLLKAAMPLLKSRNAGVVMAVCSLQYYCGVSSVKVRSGIGKALVRIHRDRREIQYVVLTSIRTLVHECPSAFAPFLQEFFVMALDPSFTRMIKLDILTALALEPTSIEAVLAELRTYVRHGDKIFACASIRAVGTVVELARIVHDRHGAKTGDKAKERRSANHIALNCLQGLVTLSKSSKNAAVVGECVIVIQRILLQLSAGDAVFGVEDPNSIQDTALQRVLVLLANALTARAKTLEETEEAESDDDDEEETTTSALERAAGVDIPPAAVASALWIIGEWAAPLNGVGLSDTTLRIRKVDDRSFHQIRLELCRLLAKSFATLDVLEKQQAIHFATKVLISSKSGSSPGTPQELALCEAILALGRLEVNTDVRDRARHESSLIHLAIGLEYDQDGLDPVPAIGMEGKPTLENLKRIFLHSKPSASSLPLEDVHYQQRAGMGEKGGDFRFGTLSSLVGHRARNAYLPLPPWASEDSASSLRDPAQQRADPVAPEAAAPGTRNTNIGGFYDIAESDDDSSSSSSESDSDDSSSSSSSGDSYDGDNNDNESTSSEEQNSDGNALLPTMPSQPFSSKSQMPKMNQQAPIMNQQPFQNGGLMDPSLIQQPQTVDSSDDSSDDEKSESDSSSSSSSDDDNAAPNPNTFGGVGNLIPIGAPQSQPHLQHIASTGTNGSVTSAADDMKGLVLEPVVVDASANEAPDIEKDSSAWMELVRSSSVGGLSIKARYLRGKTKTREIQLVGLVAEKPSTVCLQVRFENKRTDGGVVRHIRILQRSSASSSSSHIGPKKAVVPGEIVALKQGQMSNVMLGIDFNSISDRDDSLLARFDIKFTGGSVPVEIRPSLVQLLQPCKRSSSEFDAGMAKLQGFNRVDASFSVGDISFLTSRWLQKQASLTPVSKSDKLTTGVRFVACLPASGDTVFAVITTTDGGVGKVTVCCEQALAVNGIANSLKKAISEAAASG